MASQPADDDDQADWQEEERVIAWRYVVLQQAGYKPSQAELLALSATVALHEAIELLARGCQPDTAVRILL